MIYLKNNTESQKLYIPRTGIYGGPVTPPLYQEGYDDGVEHQKSLLTSTTITEDGEYVREDGFSAVTVDIDEQKYYDSGYTEGYESGYTSGSTDGYNTGYTEGYTSGYTSGSTDGFSSGYTEGSTEGFSSGYTEGQEAQKSLLSSTTITENGVYTSEDGWSAVTVNTQTGITPVYGSLTATTNGEYTPSGIDAFSAVTVNVTGTSVWEACVLTCKYNVTEPDTNVIAASGSGYKRIHIRELDVDITGSNPEYTFSQPGIYTLDYYVYTSSGEFFGSKVASGQLIDTTLISVDIQTSNIDGLVIGRSSVSSTTSVTFSNLSNPKYIPYFFLYGASVSAITIPDSVRVIDEIAFRNVGLETLTLGESLSSIGKSAFANNNQLSSITSYNVTPPALMPNAFSEIKQEGMLHIPSGTTLDYINFLGELPDGWRMQEMSGSHDYSQDYLTFRFSGNGWFEWHNSGMTTTCPIQYSINGGAWTTIGETTTSEYVDVSDGDVVRLKGTNIDGYNYNHSKYWCFSTSTDFEVEGNIFSLIYGDDFASYSEFPSGVTGYTFDSLFKGCTHLTSSENIVLPGNILIESCYRALFSNCTAMTKTLPSLNAEYLGNKCYGYMYEKCYALEKAPALMSVNGLRYDGQVAESAYTAFLISCSTVSNVITYHNGDTTVSFLNKLFGGGPTSTSNWVKGIPIDAKIYARHTEIPVPTGYTITLI